jgi:hypothetical protein
MVLFSAKLKSTLHNKVREGAQKLQPPLEQVSVKFPNEHNQTGIYDARTKKIRKQRGMATLPADTGSKEPQIKGVEISEKRNQNGASGDECPHQKGWNLSKYIF